MGIKRKVLKILSLFIIFSMLSNYMFVCSEITDIVLATEFEAGITSSLELNTNKDTEESEINGEAQEESENISENHEDIEEISSDSEISEEINLEEVSSMPENEEQVEEQEEQADSEISEDVSSDEENEEELEDVENTDSGELVLPESNAEHYSVGVDYNINRVSKFDNSLGKGVIIDGTFKIDIDAQKKHNIKVEFNLPQIFGINPIKYKIESIDDHISIVHNAEENRMIFNITESNKSGEVRILFLYDENAYSGEDIKITGTIIKENYIDEELQNNNTNDINENSEIINDIENIITTEDNPLFETKEYINLESAITKRFSTMQETSDITDDSQISDNLEETELDQTEENQEELTNLEELLAGHEEKEEFEINEKVENSDKSIGTYSLKTDITSRYKGMLYANLSVKNSKDIEYITKDTIEIEDKDFIDYVEISSKDKIINKENTEMSIQNGIILKKLIIDEEQFNFILGEYGYIEIYDESNTKIGSLNKDSNIENGKYIFNFPSLISNIKYKLINVENNGKLELILEKAISKDINISREQILDIKCIQTENTNRTKKVFGDTEVALQEILTQTEMNMQDTKTEMSLDIDNNTLSSQKENEVSFNISLKTNSEEYETFKNPVLELVFPYSVQEVEIKNISLLHKNGLSIENSEVGKNENGEIVLKLQLSGDQEEYNPSTILDGTTVNIVANIIVNRLTTEEIGHVKLKYTNENSTRIAYEIDGKDSDKYEIKFVSNSELLTVINIDNFNNNFDVLSEINADRLVGKADVGGERKTSKTSLDIINNFKADMENVVILGKLPVIGNVDNNGNSLNTTVDTSLASEIMTSGLLTKVYYSEDINTEINSDSWKEKVSDYSKVKCFKIEVINGVMHQGEKINISFNLSIPENLNYNENIFGLDTVFYKVGGVDKTKNIVFGLETEEKQIAIEDFENVQSIDKLSIGTMVTRGGEDVKDGEDVNERQILRYTTIVENISNETINNIKLKGNAHNANMYYWYTYTVISSSDGEETLTGEWIEDKEEKHTFDTFEIGSLEPGEGRIFEYQVVVNDLTLLQDINDKTVYGNITLSADGIEEKTITTIKNPIINADLEIRLEKNGLEDANYMKIVSGEDYFLRVYLKNISNTTIKNFEVNLTVPSFIQYNPLMEIIHDEYIVSTKETSTTNIITVLVEEMAPGEDGYIFFYTKITDFDIGIITMDSLSVADAVLNGRRYISNDYQRQISQDKISYDTDFFGNKEDGSKVIDGEELEYTFTAKNTGALKESALFEYFFPLGLDINSIDLYRENGSKENLYTQKEKTDDESIKTIIEESTEETSEEITPEMLANETQNDYEVNEEEELKASNEDMSVYVSDAFKELESGDTLFAQGYSEETNTYTKCIDVAPGETIKIIIKAFVNLGSGVDHQEAIVNTVSFRGAPIEKTVTYYIDYPEEVVEEEEDIPEDVPPTLENPDEGQDILYNESNEEDMAPEDEIIEEEQENTDAEDLDIKDEVIEETSEEDEEEPVEEEINPEEQKEEEQTNTVNNNENEVNNSVSNETTDDEIEKAVILNSSRQPILSAPSRNIVTNNNIENIANTREEAEEETHSISGTVWLDDNKDGVPNKTEDKVSNLKVQLYTENGEKAVRTTTTNKVGEYSFSNITKGNYIVLFSYDEELYNINTYNDDTEKQQTNVISSKTIDGKKYGISDTIELKDTDVTGLNMGLKPNDEFDLSVKSYVSRIKVRTSKGTEEYTYDENDFPKVEIPSKNIEGAQVTVTFNIKIKNDGNIAGYVTSLKNDTIGGWTFNEALNRNWQVGEDGSLYFLALENIAIEPDKENEVKLILYKEMTGNDTGVFTNTVRINGTTNEIQLEDKNSENNEANTELMISIKTGVKTYIIIGIIAILVFIVLISAINLKLLDKVDKKGKRKINIILILLFVLLMISIYAIKAQAHVYPKRFNSGEVGEVLYKWCIGYNLADDDDLRSYTGYRNVDGYLRNFYGAASTRSGFLSKKWRYSQDNASRTRTNTCMHTSDITPVGVGRSGNLSMFNDTLRSYSVVDAGYNNNSNTKAFNTMYGDYVSGIFRNGSPNKLSSKTTTWETQTLGFIAWALDTNLWGSTWNGNVYQTYKYAVPDTMYRYYSFNQAISQVSGVYNPLSQRYFINRAYIDTFKNNISSFNTQSATVFGTTSNNITQDTIKIKDLYNNGSKSYGDLKIETIGGNDYVTGIKVAFPVSGMNNNIKNRVFLQYSKNGGSTWTQYTGKIYVKSGNSVSAKNQDATYGLNTSANASSNPFVKKDICVPKSICGTNLKDFRIRIINYYYTYYSRTIFMLKVGFEQGQGITRGKRTDAARSSYIYRFDDGLEAEKHIYSVDGTQVPDLSKTIYGETGSTVVYRVTLKNTGGRTLKNIVFTDTHTHQEFIKCSTANVTVENNGGKFTYTGSIAAGKSVNIYLYYKVTRHFESTNIKAVRNSIEVTNVKASDGSNVYTKGNASTTLMTTNKLIANSEYIYLRVYKPAVYKYIYKIDSVATSNRKTDKKTTLYADYGSTVIFAIDIANDGDKSGKYGNIKNFVLEDVYNNQYLRFEGAHSSKATTYIKSGKSENWTITDNSSNSKLTLTYTGTIAPGSSARIYIKYTSTAISTKTIKVINTASITSIKNKFNYDITEDKSASGKIFRNSDSFNSKTYSASIDKRVWSNDGWVKSRYAEVGDNIIYKISISNNGSGSVAGNVKNIVIKDLLSNNQRSDNNYYLEYLGFQGKTTSGDYKKSGTSNGWKISAVANNGFTLTCTDSIAAGKTSNVYVKFNVKHGDTVNKIITNQAERTDVKNVKNLSVQEYATGNKKSSATVTLKIYSANVLKYIYSVSGNRVLPDRSKDKSQEVTIEGGDIVVFKIVVKNDGTNTDKYGAISKFEILESYPKKVFELTSDQNYGTGWTKSGDKFKYSGSLAAGKSTTLTIKLKVVGVDASLERDENGDVKIENIASLENQIVQNKNKVNINKDPNKILNGKLTDSDSAVLLISRMEISKFITKINNVSIADRSEMTNNEKFDNPVEVEKNNNLLYRIEIKNIGRTVISKMDFIDTLDSGIEFDGTTLETAKLYKGDTDTTGTDIKSQITFTGNARTRDIKYEKSFEGNQKIVLEFKCKVTKTNLYLLNLKNEFAIQSIINKTGMDIFNTPFLDLKRYDNQDFIRLKDLIVSGTIWLDKNLNGLIDDGEEGIPGIKVTLNDVTNGKKVTVTTDDNGKYKFTETNGEAAKEGATNLNQKMVLSDNRVVKATNKNQTTGNYDSSSQYIKYYLAFEYNGGQYETTPVYANDDNIEKTNNLYRAPYEKDSNAIEFNDVRETYNNRLETISYNLASSDSGYSKILEYDKNGHESIINIQNDTAASMFAYSFTNTSKNGADGIQDGDLRFLWFKNGTNSYDGETDYLKYINMGLTERRFDLKIEQDVYSIKNTINGQEMTYNFNQRGVSGEFGGEYILGGERASYDSNPYQFRLYNSDYYYNSSLYSSEDVRIYKQNTELNTEITFRVIVTNEEVDDNKEVYAVIKEIADYYSNNFMKVNTNKTIKLLDDEGFLENIDPNLNAVEAWIENGTNKIFLNVSDTNQYGQAKNFNSEQYSTLYITGFRDGSNNEIKLNEGDSFEFYIKFIVDTDETEKLKIGSENNIVEINAYSTFKKTGEPAGYIDRDSNPGNVSVIGRVDEYEDDNYRSGIDLILGTKERTSSGFVWDDSRTETVEENGIQYYADGKYDTSKTKNADEGKQNEKVQQILHKNESVDIPVQDVKATMVEIIKMKDNTGNVRYYEESINPWVEGGSPSSQTGEDGKYALTSFIPGKYETHFEYGYANGDSVSQNMQVFNGHDYKSTIYNNIDTVVEDDEILTELKKGNVSDARDDEIRRLEVIDYSEKMTNEKVENIQRTASSTISEKEFAKDTEMLARTKEYKIKPEDVAGSINTFSFDSYTSLVDGSGVRYRINNIDFGIEYRPETSLLLQKYIKNVNLTLSSNVELVNIVFNNEYENGEDTKITGTILDKDNSIGADSLQELRTKYGIKGFDYVNVDTDILQGATVKIEYLLVASNESEIDRISTNLDGLKYRKDANASYNTFMENDYTASGTAKNQLINEYYRNYDTNNQYRTKELGVYEGTDGYYGKYLGNMYYTGVIGANDVVSKLQIDKVLDYVDTDIAFYENQNHSENNYWRAANETALFEEGYLSNAIRRPLTDTNGIQFSINDNDDNERSNLAISVNDRTSINDTNVINKSLSKYLLPSSVSETESFGYIKLVTSKVLASETDTENMKYDNTSEIIQYTSQTGRATQMKAYSDIGQTVGNVDPSNPNTPNERDSSFTETVTLMPPTGLDKANYYIRVYMDYAIIVIAIVIFTLSGLFVGTKIKNHKKFYK